MSTNSGLRSAISEEGFAIVEHVLDGKACDVIIARLHALGEAQAGTRNMLSEPWCADLARQLRSLPALSAVLTPDMLAVQCTLFEKSTDRNWLVTCHQDLSIPVAERIEHTALRGWATKEDGLYVQAPEALLAQLLAVRIHLDECGIDDGPLRVMPGTHNSGRLSDEAITALRSSHQERACPVSRGGVMLMRPLLLHASSKASGASRRRVLHFLFGPRQLPFNLRWAHTI